MADIMTIVPLICFGVVVVCYFLFAAGTVADCWAYINSGLIDEEEFAYAPLPPKGKHIRSRGETGRRVERRPVKRNRNRTRRPACPAPTTPSWVYTTML